MFTQRNYSEGIVFPERKTDIQKISVFLQLFASYLGAVVTFHFQLLNQTPVSSSALTTSIAWLVLLAVHKNKRSLILAVYCGSFAGMSMLGSSSDGMESTGFVYRQAAAFSLAVALSYVLMHSVSTHFPKATFVGYGGRLGTTAFISSLLCSLMLREGVDTINLNQLTASPETLGTYFAYAIIACSGAIIPCLLLGKRWRTVDMYYLTGLTAFLSLIGSLLFAIFFDGLSLAPAAFYTGSFVSMTKFHLCTPRKLAIAGALSGILMLYVIHVFNGIGGNLGLTAMLSVLCVTIFYNAIACLPAGTFRKAFVVVLAMALGSLAGSYMYSISTGQSDVNSIAANSGGDWKIGTVIVDGTMVPREGLISDALNPRPHVLHAAVEEGLGEKPAHAGATRRVVSRHPARRGLIDWLSKRLMP